MTLLLVVLEILVVLKILVVLEIVVGHCASSVKLLLGIRERQVPVKDGAATLLIFDFCRPTDA